MHKVLVVDDDPDTVDSITKWLQKDYEIIQAYGGNEVMEKVEKYNPDGIVLDVMMHDKDGYKVCKELKANPQYKDIPVLLLTAVVDNIPTTNYTMRGGMEIEAEDYIDKPVEKIPLFKGWKTF